MRDEDWKAERRQRVRRLVALLPLILVGAAVFVALFSYVVMRLWNWLMPELFGLATIDQWQALGILILSKILFGGFSGGSGRNGELRRRRWEERWEKRRLERLTPEERERFRSSGPGSGSIEPPPAAPAT